MLKLIYDNHTINQRESDNYINLTQMCKATHKKLNDWTKTEDYKELISAISTDTNIFVSDLVQTKRGGTDQGTWGHPFVAIALAAWIDKSFYAWIIRHTFDLVTTGKTQLEPELEALRQEKLELTKEVHNLKRDKSLWEIEAQCMGKRLDGYYQRIALIKAAYQKAKKLFTFDEMVEVNRISADIWTNLGIPEPNKQKSLENKLQRQLRYFWKNKKTS